MDTLFQYCILLFMVTGVKMEKKTEKSPYLDDLYCLLEPLSKNININYRTNSEVKMRNEFERENTEIKKLLNLDFQNFLMKTTVTSATMKNVISWTNDSNIIQLSNLQLDKFNIEISNVFMDVTNFEMHFTGNITSTHLQGEYVNGKAVTDSQQMTVRGVSVSEPCINLLESATRGSVELKMDNIAVRGVATLYKYLDGYKIHNIAVEYKPENLSGYEQPQHNGRRTHRFERELQVPWIYHSGYLPPRGIFRLDRENISQYRKYPNHGMKPRTTRDTNTDNTIITEIMKKTQTLHLNRFILHKFRNIIHRTKCKWQSSYTTPKMNRNFKPTGTPVSTHTKSRTQTPPIQKNRTAATRATSTTRTTQKKPTKSYRTGTTIRTKPTGKTKNRKIILTDIPVLRDLGGNENSTESTKTTTTTKPNVKTTTTKPNVKTTTTKPNVKTTTTKQNVKTTTTKPNVKTTTTKPNVKTTTTKPNVKTTTTKPNVKTTTTTEANGISHTTHPSNVRCTDIIVDEIGAEEHTARLAEIARKTTEPCLNCSTIMVENDDGADDGTTEQVTDDDNYDSNENKAKEALRGIGVETYNEGKDGSPRVLNCHFVPGNGDDRRSNSSGEIGYEGKPNTDGSSEQKTDFIEYYDDIQNTSNNPLEKPDNRRHHEKHVSFAGGGFLNSKTRNKTKHPNEQFLHPNVAPWLHERNKFDFQNKQVFKGSPERENQEYGVLLDRSYDDIPYDKGYENDREYDNAYYNEYYNEKRGIYIPTTEKHQGKHPGRSHRKNKGYTRPTEDDCVRDHSLKDNKYNHEVRNFGNTEYTHTKENGPVSVHGIKENKYNHEVNNFGRTEYTPPKGNKYINEDINFGKTEYTHPKENDPVSVLGVKDNKYNHEGNHFGRTEYTPLKENGPVSVFGIKNNKYNHEGNNFGKTEYTHPKESGGRLSNLCDKGNKYNNNNNNHNKEVDKFGRITLATSTNNQKCIRIFVPNNYCDEEVKLNKTEIWRTKVSENNCEKRLL